MAKLIGRTMSETGEVVINDAVLAKGGEGKVHTLISHTLSGLADAEDLVAKIYFKPEEANRGPKVAAMLKNPPADQTSIAWVKAILFDENKKFVGYLMRKLDTKNFRQWYELSNMKDRQSTAPDFDVRYALNASRNFLVALHFIHEAGHKVGDINESNLFINADSTVMLVDMDSAQIAQNDKIYPCEVGKPEFTASEISHGKLKDNPRTVETDIFAYSVMIFQMLTGGSHPMDGVYVPDDDPPNVTDKIRKGSLPTLQPYVDKDFKPVPRIPAGAIPTRLKNVLIQSLSNNPSNRPDTSDFLAVLDDVLKNLVQCDVEKKHWFDKRDNECGWCAHKASGNFDPWGHNENLKKATPHIAQSSLPSVSFGEQKKPVKAKRAPVQSVPQQAQNTPQNASNSPYSTNPQSSASASPQRRSQPSQGVSQQSPYAQQPHNAQSLQNSYYKPEGPRKHKGKIVLEYMDGSLRPRPPMSVLLQNNRKVAWQAFTEEFPQPLRIWWDKYRYTAKIPALIIGLLVSLVIAAGWYMVVPMAENIEQIPQMKYTELILWYVALISAITSATAGLFFTISAFISRYRDIKILSKDNIQEEGYARTILHYISVALFYGPLFLVMLLFYIIIGLLKFGSAVAKA